MRMLALLLVTLQYHLPTHDLYDDSLCVESVAPNTDLESSYVMVQPRWQSQRVWSREYVRDQQGALKQFTVSDTIEALYWVEVADRTGNRLRIGHRCGPIPYQVARTTAVPIAPPFAAPDGPGWRYYDIAGRKLTDTPRTPGVYFAARVEGARMRRRLVILR